VKKEGVAREPFCRAVEVKTTERTDRAKTEGKRGRCTPEYETNNQKRMKGTRLTQKLKIINLL